ncbi:MAG: SRPBCC domain-containing protein [Dehalococcoidia bacterium]
MTAENFKGRTDTASRLIQASPERIYEAFTDGSTLMNWLPPGGMTGRALEYQFEEDGQYRIELRYGNATQSSGKTADRTDVTKGRFVELVAGRRIRQTVEFESDNKAFSREMTMTWTFDPARQGTSVSVTAENVPSGISKEDHDKGLTSSLESLAAFVERHD